MPKRRDSFRCPQRQLAQRIVGLTLFASVALLIANHWIDVHAQQSDYLIGPNDVLTVNVLNQPTLSGKFTVVADGTVTYPLLGPVSVGGLSLAAVERQLTAKLADGYLKKPVVSVALDQARSQYVFVTGEVRQAGTYPLLGRTTALEILLKAGVLTQTAGTEVIVTRGAPTDGKSPEGQVIRLSLDALQRGDASQQVVLQAGDHLFVPRSELPIPVYVMGLVNQPGLYQLPKGATVLQALAQAGGVADRGSTGRLKIVRKVEGKNVDLKASLEDLVQSGDTIMVRRRFF